MLPGVCQFEKENTVNLNATLFAQFVVFFILAMFTMKFVWPPLMKTLDERAKRISEGLAAAERGKHELAVAEKRVQVELQQVHEEGQKRIVDAERRAALSADVDALGALQVEKESALAALAESSPTDEEKLDLARRARSNLGLLRQLADLHRSLLVGDAPSPATYGPRGEPRVENRFSLRRP